jgi:tRNA (guanine26-N2/guanine27-N2)-dimethyltransferase
VIQKLITILFQKQFPTKTVLWKLLDHLEEEADAPPLFYTTDKVASLLKISTPSRKTLFEQLKKKNYQVTQTHFHPMGFKTNAPKNVIIAMFKTEKEH